jgi:hypothetical protein
MTVGAVGAARLRGAAAGAFERKLPPPTRPPDLAASAPSGRPASGARRAKSPPTTMRRCARFAAARSSSDELFITIAGPCAPERRSEGNTDNAGANALAPAARAAIVSERLIFLRGLWKERL